MDNKQWFIITAIGGKEDSIVESLKEKIKNYGYEDLVGEIKLLKHTIVDEEVFTPGDINLPKTMRNTKTTKWETLPNGSYKKIRTRELNKFPGYIFVNMVMNQDVWYAIRNTPGVLGFVGSSGKGALPIPISIEEFEMIQPSSTIVNKQINKIENEPINKKIYTTNIKPGYRVLIIGGSLEGEKGEVSSIDLNNGTAKVKVEFLGRVTETEVSLDDIKIEE